MSEGGGKLRRRREKFGWGDIGELERMSAERQWMYCTVLGEQLGRCHTFDHGGEVESDSLSGMTTHDVWVDVVTLYMYEGLRGRVSG